MERSPIVVPRVFRSSVKDDPYVHSRDHEIATEKAAPVTMGALARGETHAFVATDLLWLDGQPIDDVPLLERKRLLEAILSESFLVRVSAFVRPSAVMTLVSWASLGFDELSYRAANSRYAAGGVNDEWAIVKAPDTPTRAPTPVPRRASGRRRGTGQSRPKGRPTGLREGRQPVHGERDECREPDHRDGDPDHEPGAGRAGPGRLGPGRPRPEPESSTPITAAPGGPGCRGCHRPRRGVVALVDVVLDLPPAVFVGDVARRVQAALAVARRQRDGDLISRLLNCAAPLTAVWIWLTPVADRPSSELQSNVW